MKQHSILMKGPLVLQTKADQKTQTRRLTGLDEINKDPERWEFVRFFDGYAKFCEKHNHTNEVYVKCPYGQPDDILWVRESFRVNSWCPDDVELSFRYEADGSVSPSIYFEDDEVFNRYWEQSCNDLADAGYEIDPDENYSDYKYDALRLRPSIHMPKSACRLYLQITDIRVERLNEISEEDAKAEGAEERAHRCGGFGYYEAGGEVQDCVCQKWHREPIVMGFMDLWQSINGPDSWQVNPFVWVINFKKIDKPS